MRAVTAGTAATIAEASALAAIAANVRPSCLLASKRRSASTEGKTGVVRAQSRGGVVDTRADTGGKVVAEAEAEAAEA